MKKMTLLFHLLPFFAFAQGSRVFDSLVIHSKLLNMDRNYAVYLPPDYENSARSYPVLYLLHGGGVNHTGWLQQGEIQTTADKAINEGLATAMIIVMPDAYTLRRGYYQNKENWLFEDFFFTEFMPHVEKKYRIRKEKHFRAISGFSIGGKAAFTYALHHPDLFAASCPISAAVDAATKDEPAKKNDKPVAMNETDLDFYKDNNITRLVNNLPDSTKNAVRWYIDCGDDDFLYESNVLLRTAMLKKGIQTEFRVRQGGHNWDYWRSAMPAVLGFISTGFREY